MPGPRQNPPTGQFPSPTIEDYRAIVKWANAPPEPSGLDPVLARLYRATVYLACGAHRLAEYSAVVDGSGFFQGLYGDERELALLLPGVCRFQGALWKAEQELNDLDWFWAALRSGRHVVLDGWTFNTPLRAAVEVARSFLSHMELAMWVFGDPDRSPMELLEAARSRWTDDKIAEIIRDRFVRFNSMAWFPKPDLIVAEARADISRPWVQEQIRNASQRKAGPEKVRPPEGVARRQPPPQTAGDAVLYPSLADAFVDGRQHLEGLSKHLNGMNAAWRQVEGAIAATDNRRGTRCPVTLGSESERSVRVKGVAKNRLTESGYKVIKALVEAYPGRLGGDTLALQATDAVNILKRLARDPDWAAAIDLPGDGGQGQGYGLRW